MSAGMVGFTPMYSDLRMVRANPPTGISNPVRHAVIRRFSERNTFGNVRRNRNGSIRPHQGWDYYAPVGTPCLAIADGKIVAVRNSPSGYGLHVVLEFSFDFDGDGRKDTLFAAYCHMSRIDVKVGQSVRCGQVIGLTGDTGNAKGMRGDDAHLHFEIRTVAVPGRGLAGRLSPMTVLGKPPLKHIAVS